MAVELAGGWSPMIWLSLRWRGEPFNLGLQITGYLESLSLLPKEMTSHRPVMPVEACTSVVPYAEGGSDVYANEKYVQNKIGLCCYADAS